MAVVFCRRQQGGDVLVDHQAGGIGAEIPWLEVKPSSAKNAVDTRRFLTGRVTVTDRTALISSAGRYSLARCVSLGIYRGRHLVCEPCIAA